LPAAASAGKVCWNNDGNPAMNKTSARLAFVFSNLGHFYIHMFTAMYAVIVLQLERDWSMSYEDLLRLWFWGSLMVGVMALPAGRLGDWLTARVMMIVYFIGLGGASIVCGLIDGPRAMTAGLVALGVFAAIYHPIGIPWLIRNAPNNAGKVLAVNGIFGSIGTGGAGIAAGALIAVYGWRAAFIVPGAICLATGLAMAYCLATGRLSSAPPGRPSQAPQSRGDALRVYVVLLVAMFFGGILYHVMQNGLPKVFSEELRDVIGEGPMMAGLLTSFVFVSGGIMQLIGGGLADRFALNRVYLICWFFQMVFVTLTAMIGGVGLVGMAALAIMANVASQPAENMMLARYAPEKHHGLAFGLKFVLSFLTGPLAVTLIAFVREQTGGMYWLFTGLGIAGVAVVLLILALPTVAREQRASAPAE
jgi:FSR family fosmidomycin resistance protein-like MFS transporter